MAEDVETGRYATIKEIAKAEKINPSYARTTVFETVPIAPPPAPLPRPAS
jgi:hypothetical protein